MMYVTFHEFLITYSFAINQRGAGVQISSSREVSTVEECNKHLQFAVQTFPALRSADQHHYRLEDHGGANILTEKRSEILKKRAI